MKMVVFYKEDFTNPLHPFFWEELLEQLDIDLPASREDYPDNVLLEVAAARCDSA